MTGTPSNDRADVSLVAEAIEEAFGERCPDYAEGCPCCDVWAEYDKLRGGFAEGMKRATDALDKYRASLSDIPLGHETPHRGASTYNWKVAVFEEIRDAILAEIGER